MAPSSCPSDVLDTFIQAGHIDTSFHCLRKVYTEVFVVDRSNNPPTVLLGEKKRGFKAGNLLGYGGKVESTDKSIQAAALRELKEESGLSFPLEKLTDSGVIYVQFNEPKKKYLEIHAFCVNISTENDSALSSLCETDEMRPKWYRVDNLPWDKMLPDVRDWYPLVWADSKFVACFTLGEDDIVLHKSVVELSESNEADPSEVVIHGK